VLALAAAWCALVAGAKPAAAATLLQTETQLAELRQHIQAGDQPWAAAWAEFRSGRLRQAMGDAPRVFVGPTHRQGVSGALELALDRDGSRARSAAIGYALTGRREYAAKARQYVLAWARRNIPTRYGDCRDRYMGTYQSHGAFSFAYAYDLSKASSVYSSADRRRIRAYFRRFCDALETYVAVQRRQYYTVHSSATAPYQWSTNPLGLRYTPHFSFVGGDLMALTQVARFALARLGGYPAEVRQMLSTSDELSIRSVIRHASAPRNQGDGVEGHPVPVPQVQIFKAGAYDNPRRGGCVDYMTYNARAVTILLMMGRRAGADMSSEQALLYESWRYLARFVGPDAEPSPAPRDVIGPVNGPRFVLPLALFGDEFLADAEDGDEATHYDTQFLGPMTLTLWP
jgi:hypothetical protein